MCAYGPSTLGYNNPVVDEADREQINHGDIVKLTSPVMVELAEKLGPFSMPYFRITNDDGSTVHFDWIARGVKRGAYFLPYHNHFICAAHNDSEIEEPLEIANAAFLSMKP